MKRDAFEAGVEPGGLYSQSDIKLLLCYMLNGAGQPMARNDMLDIVCGGGMANFFDTSAAIDDLLELGNLRETDDGRLSLTDTGLHATATLSDMLPYTLRERSVSAALQLMARRRNEFENHVDIDKRENGYVVTCTVGDNASPLLAFSLLVADDRQAELVRDNFLSDPLLLYQSTIAVLTGGARFEGTDRIVMNLR